MALSPLGHLGAQDPIIAGALTGMSIDSMMHYVRQLSGEEPVDVGNGPQLIVSRHKNHPGNAMAQAYIEQKLSQFGYSATVQSFSATGKNVLASLPGSIPTLPPVLIGAHYDAMPGGVYDAPGADDNGSGTAALLEIARIISGMDLEHTVMIAFWDEEEQGLVGSAFHAAGLAANDQLLRGVINMDAISYDSNGDTKARIHARQIGNSIEIADTVFAVRDHYSIALDLLLTIPGAAYSDHASFWNENYGAVLIIEEFGADGNPFYHTPNDKVEHFDIPYYEKLARLSLGTLVTLAEPVTYTGVPEVPSSRTTLSSFPNPFSSQIHLWADLEEAGGCTITLYDAVGNEVMRVHDGTLARGRNSITIDTGALACGSYVLTATTAASSAALKLVKLP